MKPKVLVISGYGINSEAETAAAFNLTGSEAEIVPVNDLINGDNNFDQYQILALPGGFSFGDDTGSGKAMANKILNKLQEALLKFVQKDTLTIGICNGFQILTNLGLVPARNQNYSKPEAALMHNNTNQHQCRWVTLKNNSRKCVWTKDIDLIRMPISHGEGNFYANDEVLKDLNDNDQIVFKYVYQDGRPANSEFPINPNGSLQDIAGICDPSGRIFGLMPHPERFNSFTNEEGWELKKEALIRTNKEIPQEGAGLQIFKNAAQYFA